MNNMDSDPSIESNRSARADKRGWLGGMLGVAAAVALASAASPAMADDCGWGGIGFGISFSSGYSSWGGYTDCFSVGYSAPVYAYAGPRHYYGGYGYGGGGYYPRYGGGWYQRYRYDDCAPRYYHAPSYRNYYYRAEPRYYRYDNYRSRRYNRYDDCGPYSMNDGAALDGYSVASAGNDNVLRYRSEQYVGDSNFAPDGGFKVVRQRTDMQRAEELDPQWAGGAIAMLRKGEADEAIVALEQAAYPESFAIEPAAASQPVITDTGAPSSPAIATGNPEAIRMLGLAKIADGQIDEGVAQIVEAYRLDPSLASTPIDERLFPTGARFDVRDLVRKVSVRANRTNSADAWFALGVLMQAEDRDSVALDMVLKASGAGMDQAIISPMADALRRVVYGRG